ncbi:MAG: amidohydrolase [Syntrophales bacterium]
MKKNACCLPGRLLVGLILTVLWIAPASADEKTLLAAIDEQAGNCKVVSQKIYGYKELGQQEFKSSQLLMEELRKLGFSVTGDLKVPDDLIKGGVAKTAFRAELNGKAPGPTIALMLEYDSLANGHSCGHNLIAASGLLAAAGLARLMKETPGRLLVIGTPDEERGSLGGGKTALLEGGHFQGADVVLITHPDGYWSTDQRFLAMKRATFVFKGKAAHAASAPDKGVNALRAALLTFNSVDALREHLRQDVRIHGIIKKGGEAVNVVPALAETEFAARALDTATMEDAYKKMVNCAKATELATGATLEFKEPRASLKAPIAVPVLAELMLAKMKAQGLTEKDITDKVNFGSSDLGNVAHASPTFNLTFKIAPYGIAGHSDAMREAAGSEKGWKATVTAAKIIASAAYEMLQNPAKVKEIQESFKEAKAKEGK